MFPNSDERFDTNLDSYTINMHKNTALNDDNDL
jgi:hypothetical protein